MNRPSKEELIKFSVNYEKDTDFAAKARLLQSMWRVKNNYPINNETKSDYGNFVEIEFAKKNKVNFLTSNIKRLVTEKIVEIRNNGGLVNEPRIWNNLLSSQPLCFNLFGELHYDLNLASKYFNKLFPEQVLTVTNIDFEYSSKRSNPDESAFDVFVEYLNKDLKKCFIGIEVKYQENLREESPAKADQIFKKHKADYLRLTNESKAFIPNAIEKLRFVPLSQIWRDHLLAFNMSQDYYDGIFVFLYPFQNDECHAGIESYKKLLFTNDETKTKFYPRNLVRFITSLRDLNNTAWTRELEERYIGKIQ